MIEKMVDKGNIIMIDKMKVNKTEYNIEPNKIQ